MRGNKLKTLDSLGLTLCKINQLKARHQPGKLTQRTTEIHGEQKAQGTRENTIEGTHEEAQRKQLGANEEPGTHD